MARVRGLVLSSRLQRATFDQADRGLRRLGPRDRPGDHDRGGVRTVLATARSLGPATGRRAHLAQLPPQGGVPGAGHPWRDRRADPVRHGPAPRRRARDAALGARRDRPLPARARARRDQPPDRPVRAIHRRCAAMTTPTTGAIDRQPLSDDGGRAARPERTGLAVAPDGVRLGFDVYGAGDPTLVLMPSAPIIHSRQWKAQVPYLSRHYRVVTYDGRGNGRSDRPADPALYHDDRYVADLETVMDATETERAIVVGLCTDGVWRAIRLAAEKPDRVLGIVAFAVGVPRIAPPQPHYVASGKVFDEVLPTTEGWAKNNRHYWR